MCHTGMNCHWCMAIIAESVQCIVYLSFFSANHRVCTLLFSKSYKLYLLGVSGSPPPHRCNHCEMLVRTLSQIRTELLKNTCFYTQISIDDRSNLEFLVLINFQFRK